MANRKASQNRKEILSICFGLQAKYPGEPFQLSSIKLREIVNRYKPYITVLENEGILELIHNYSVEHKICKRYLLHIGRMKSELPFLTLKNHFKIDKTITQAQSIKSAQINMDGLDYGNPDCIAPWAVYHNLRYLNRDQKVNRVHSSLSSFPKIYRHRIMAPDNEPLVLLDISGSNPFIFSSLLGDHPDELAFRNSCINGTLYQDIADQLGHTKQEIKAAMLPWFGLNKFKIEYGIIAKIIDLYPNMNNVLLEQKKGDYKNVTYFCMQNESKIMIDLVCHELVKRYPGVFHYTIHDAICIPEILEDETKDIIKKASIQVLGIGPHIKTKYLTEKCTT